AVLVWFFLRHEILLEFKRRYSCPATNSKNIKLVHDVVALILSTMPWHLSRTDQRRFAHYSIELSHTWNYNNFAKKAFLVEIAPLIGYAHFIRKYDGEVQDLKTQKKILDYHRMIASKGIILGGQLAIKHYMNKKEAKKEGMILVLQ
ncbi:MAG: hypothetical protein ACREOI_01835, partial [bacterium]